MCWSATRRRCRTCPKGAVHLMLSETVPLPDDPGRPDTSMPPSSIPRRMARSSQTESGYTGATVISRRRRPSRADREGDWPPRSTQPERILQALCQAVCVIRCTPDLRKRTEEKCWINRRGPPMSLGCPLRIGRKP